MKILKYTIAFLLGCILFPTESIAQGFDDDFARVKYDTNYIRVYRDELTTRLYVSRKQNSLRIGDTFIGTGLKYRTNDNVLVGAGFTYSFFTLNLAVKFPFLNKDDETLLETYYLDLTTRSMFRSFLIDSYFQWNKGYFLSNPEEVFALWNTTAGYPLRQDMRTSLVGLGVQYLFNSERFSYKASFVQNEFQKRSAGSPIAGVEAYWQQTLGDSALIPSQVPAVRSLEQEAFNQSDVFTGGLNGGYAYTFVWKQRLYISLASTIGISAGFHYHHDSGRSLTTSKGFTPAFTNLSRVSLGYNTEEYFVGVSYIYFSSNSFVGDPGDWMRYSTGNIKINFVKRFRLKRSIRILRPDLWLF